MRKISYNSDEQLPEEDNIKKFKYLKRFTVNNIKPINKNKKKRKENSIIKKFKKITYNNNVNKSQRNFFETKEIRVGPK